MQVLHSFALARPSPSPTPNLDPGAAHQALALRSPSPYAYAYAYAYPYPYPLAQVVRTKQLPGETLPSQYSSITEIISGQTPDGRT